MEFVLNNMPLVQKNAIITYPTHKTPLKHSGSASEIYEMQRKHEQGSNLSLAILEKDQLQVGFHEFLKLR